MIAPVPVHCFSITFKYIHFLLKEIIKCKSVSICISDTISSEGQLSESVLHKCEADTFEDNHEYMGIGENAGNTVTTCKYAELAYFIQAQFGQQYSIIKLPHMP